MKQKLLFTAQVFSVLLMILSIFVGTLKRDLNKERTLREHAVIEMQQEDNNNTSGSFFSPFVTSFLEVIE
jgi:hypothetical protein